MHFLAVRLGNGRVHYPLQKDSLSISGWKHYPTHFAHNVYKTKMNIWCSFVLRDAPGSLYDIFNSATGWYPSLGLSTMVENALDIIPGYDWHAGCFASPDSPLVPLDRHDHSTRYNEQRLQHSYFNIPQRVQQIQCVQLDTQGATSHHHWRLLCVAD